MPELRQALSTLTWRVWQTSFAGQPTSETQAVTALGPWRKGAASVSSAKAWVALGGQGAKRRAGPPGTMSQPASAEAAGEPLTSRRQRQTPPPMSLAASWALWGPRRGPGSNSEPPSDRVGAERSASVNQRRRTRECAAPERPQLPPAP